MRSRSRFWSRIHKVSVLEGWSWSQKAWSRSWSLSRMVRSRFWSQTLRPRLHHWSKCPSDFDCDWQRVNMFSPALLWHVFYLLRYKSTGSCCYMECKRVKMCPEFQWFHRATLGSDKCFRKCSVWLNNACVKYYHHLGLFLFCFVFWWRNCN